MIEVMTIDSSGKVNDLEPVTDLDLSKSIGKLFIVAEDNSISEGTVFVIPPEECQRYSLPQDKLICLTDFHNIGEIFDRPRGFFVSFENVCRSGEFKSVLKHTPIDCPQNIYKAHPASQFRHHVGSKNIDPITGYAYSLENDIDFLVLECECSCGNTFAPRDMIPLRIKELDETMALTLVGYPGAKVMESRAMPYSSIYPGNSYVTEGNVLKQCTGAMIKGNEDLIAVENSSVAGMSGSPILQTQDGKLVAVSILLGGPAVKNHYEFVSLSHYVLENRYPEGLQLFESLKNDLPNFCSAFWLRCLESGLSTNEEKGSISVIRIMYYDLVKNFAAEQTPENSVKLLSHNLGFRLKKFLVKYIRSFSSYLCLPQ